MQFTRQVRFECCHCGRHEDIPICFRFNDDRVPRLEVFDLGTVSQLIKKGLRVIDVRDEYTGGKYIMCAECYDDYLKLRRQTVDAQMKFLGLKGSREG